MAAVLHGDAAAAYKLQLGELGSDYKDYEYAYNLQLAEALAVSDATIARQLANKDIIDLTSNQARAVIDLTDNEAIDLANDGYSDQMRAESAGPSGSGTQQLLSSHQQQQQDYDHSGKGKSRASGPAVVLERCQICLEEMACKCMHVVGGCGHRFCQHCLGRHTGHLARERRFPVHCPAPGCEQVIPVKECAYLLLDPDLLNTLRQLEAEASIPEGSKLWCPAKECSALVILEEAGPDKPMECPCCHRLLCPWCRTIWHGDLTCGEYQALPQDQRQLEDRQLMALAKARQWRQCSQCRMYVELTMGCNHMTCKCRYEFCYKCGGAWDSRGKCSSGTCALWDEPMLLQRQALQQQALQQQGRQPMLR